MDRTFAGKAAAVLMAVLMVLSVCSIFADTAYAAEATMSLSGGGTAEKGDTVTITLKYTGATFGSATAKITYDSDVLEYSSCSGAEANGSGGTVIVTMANGSGTDNLTCKLSFKAKKVGKATVKASTTDIYNIDLEELSAGSKSTTVTVEDSSDAVSTNANLSELYISAGKLSPAFSKNVTSYTVKVDNDVTEFLITAVKEDSNATTKVTGSKEMKVGENTRKVTVTAESGKTKTYTITIIRAEAGSSSQKPDSSQTQKPDSSQTQKPDNSGDKEEPKGIEAVVNDVTYLVEEDLAKVEIPETFSVSAADYNDKQIPVVQSKDGNIVLAFLKEQESGEGKWFYYNDSKDQFLSKKALSLDTVFAYGEAMAEEAGDGMKQPDGTENPGDGTDNTDASGNELLGTTELMLMIFGATLGLLLLVVICLQIGIIRDNKRK